MKTQYAKNVLLAAMYLCLATCSGLQAQVRFYAQAPKQVAVNQNLQVSFVVENGEAKTLKPPAFEGFQVLGGPNTSTSVQIINGNMSKTVTYSYVLRPTKEGSFKIGKASIKVESATMESNELAVEVTKAVAQPQAQQRQSNNPMGWDPFDDPFFRQDPFQQQEPQVSQQDIEKQLSENVFVRMVVSRAELYEGEGLTATLKLYFRLGVGNVQLSKAPAFNGFWSQEVELPQNQKPYEETVNGQRFNVYEIQKYNLYPQKSGKLEISPAEVNTVVQAQVRSGGRRGFFDDMFGRVQNFKHQCNSNKTIINVKALPEANKPAAFSGAVGSYEYKTSLSSTEAKTDDAITYSVKVSGSGNLKLIEAPTLDLPESFEVYDPKVKENVASQAGGISGSKQFDFLIIPRQPGDYKIPSQQFSFFNPSQQKYITITSPEYALKVTGEASKTTSTVATATASKDDVKLLGSDIRYIKTKTQFGESSLLASSPVLYGLYGAPFLIFIGLMVMKHRRETLEADVVGMKKRKATKLAQRRLKTAAKFLAAQDKKGFYNEVSQATWGYLGDKLSIDMAELNKENVEDKLQTKQVSAETIASLMQLMSTCDLALYAPVGEGGEMKSNYDRAIQLIASLEDEIK